MTQKQIADKLGVVPKTVSKWEMGNGFPDVSTRGYSQPDFKNRFATAPLIWKNYLTFPNSFPEPQSAFHLFYSVRCQGL